MPKPTLVADRSAIAYEDRGFKIPYRMAVKIDGYIERGEPVGHFLEAVITNDLQEACGRGDRENLENLPAFTAYFYNYAPSPCWGSKEKYKAWMDLFLVESSEGK